MKVFTTLLLCFILCSSAKAQTVQPKLALQDFAKGFYSPIDITNCGDSRLFVAERLGKIWIIDSAGNKSAEPFLDITDKVFTVFPNDYDERGLLGFTFHPNYPDSPYVYVNYIGHDSNSHISRFTLNPNNPNKALAHSQLMLITISQPKAADFVNHKGGCIKFGPDGYLYAGFGDGGSAGDPLNTAQNTRLLLGKMIRIDVNHPDPLRQRNYAIPAGNPFVNDSKAKDEIWATGLRNPYRFSFDKKTGVMWLPDVGQDKWEEINIIATNAKGGKNFGWSCYEANHNYKFDSCDYNGMPYTFPVIEYKHSQKEPCTSITGGYVYRGTKFKNMLGNYYYCDYCTGKFSTVYKDNTAWVNVLLTQADQTSYVGFGEGSDGELYVVNAVNGEIYHLVDSAAMIAATPEMQKPAVFAQSVFARIYPNPNHGRFNVEYTAAKDETCKISITNSFGVELMRETRFAIKGSNNWSFSSAQLQKNVYMLHIQTANRQFTQKFLVN